MKERITLKHRIEKSRGAILKVSLVLLALGFPLAYLCGISAQPVWMGLAFVCLVLPCLLAAAL